MSSVLRCGVLALIAATCTGLAQDAQAAKFYKLDFVVKEVEGGKVLNSRAYSTMILAANEGRAAIRIGTKVPFQTTPEIRYADLGVNIDCDHVREMDGGLALRVAAELSSVAEQQNPPVIRQNKWDSNVVVMLRKPTVLFTSDDPASRQQMQLELTATPVR